MIKGIFWKTNIFWGMQRSRIRYIHCFSSSTMSTVSTSQSLHCFHLHPWSSGLRLLLDSMALEKLSGGTSSKSLYSSEQKCPITHKISFVRLKSKESRLASTAGEYTLRKKVLPSTYFWCFSLSQIEDSIQYACNGLPDTILSFQILNRVTVEYWAVHPRHWHRHCSSRFEISKSN